MTNKQSAAFEMLRTYAGIGADIAFANKDPRQLDVRIIWACKILHDFNDGKLERCQQRDLPLALKTLRKFAKIGVQHCYGWRKDSDMVQRVERAYKTLLDWVREKV